jgi:excisionase family DNA binding protein
MSDDKILLTVAEVAKLTGFAEGTLRHFVSQKRIPVVRISARCVRFRRSDIDSWIEQQLIPAMGENTR